MQLDLSNVVNISVAEAPVGVGEYNTSNLALFTDETPGDSFPDDGFAIYKSPTQVGVDFGTGSKTFQMANAIFSQQPNILANSGYLVVIALQPSETLAAAITRTVGLVQYFGIINDSILSQTDLLAAAAVIQPLNKIGAFVSRSSADVETAGKLDLLRSGGFTKSRGIYYGATTDTDALVMLASYAGRALSTNFSGSNTTQTMHLKDLAGVQPDPSMTQTLLTKCKAAGADTYISLQGVAKVFCSGANKFFDQVYNLGWFVGALEIAGFNYLAQSSTKIPQTEDGMDGLKNAYRVVCEQGVTNRYSAPGAWRSSTTFGNQADLIANISQRGYYIYSVPISQQSQADRLARKAPLVQLAVKEAGAIHESDVIVNINA
jgi:hypothetical protein